MPDIEVHRCPDGGIDYRHYRRRAYHLRIEARRRAFRFCALLASELIGASVRVATSILFPAGAADGAMTRRRPISAQRVPVGMVEGRFGVMHGKAGLRDV